MQASAFEVKNRCTDVIGDAQLATPTIYFVLIQSSSVYSTTPSPTLQALCPL